MKKLLSLALVLVLAVGSAVPALAAPTMTDIFGGRIDNEVVDGDEAVASNGVLPINLDDDWEEDWNWEDWDWDWEVPEEPGEVTYTLVVNGQPTDVELTVEDWTTYADGAELAAILGVELPDGPVAVRAAAEAAGWDVVWYDGGWRGVDQEVSLFDKSAYMARLQEEFGPFQRVIDAVVAPQMEQIYADTPSKLTQTVNVTLTDFSTLDGDRTYTGKVLAQVVCGKGGLDMTVTFDLWELLGLDAVEWWMAENADELPFAPEELAMQLKEGQIELLLDLNEGSMAFRAPLLGLADEDMADWQIVYDEMDGDMIKADIAALLYAQLLDYADWLSGADAQENYQYAVDALAVLVGKQTVTTQGGQTTWQITTERIHNTLRSLGLEEEDLVEFDGMMKRYELAIAVDQNGKVELTMDLRMALGELLDRFDLGDLQITAQGTTKKDRGSSWMEFHLDNAGKLRLDSVTAPEQTDVWPRTPASVEGEELAGIVGEDGPVVILPMG